MPADLTKFLFQTLHLVAHPHWAVSQHVLWTSWLPLREKVSHEPCKLVEPLWKTAWRFLKKLKLELPYDPAIPLLGIYPNKTLIQKDTRTPLLTAAPVTVAKTWE